MLPTLVIPAFSLIGTVFTVVIAKHKLVPKAEWAANHLRDKVEKATGWAR
ncbi:MAG: hypothetical protein ACK4OM_04255 [Alphaproteobacteria bacterium]